MSPASANTLQVAESSFLLLATGPNPLAIDGAKVGQGLAARMVDLVELRSILRAPGTSDMTKDAAWRELVSRSRTDGPAWVVGCVGVAAPGLTAVCARACATAPRQMSDDIVSDAVTEFVAQLARLDLSRPHVVERLLLWARKASLRTRGREIRHAQDLTETGDDFTTPAAASLLDVGPAELIGEAVRLKVISAREAALIRVTRVEGVTLAEVAKECGEPAQRLYQRRARAESHLTSAIASGLVSVTDLRGVSNPGR